MIKYLLLIPIIVGSFSAFAVDETKEEIKPNIGSIDDSGRVDPDEYQFSNAENKLWMNKHLLNIQQPARLHYEFEKTGSYEEGFIDDVFLDIVSINVDDTRNTTLEFFTGERKQKVSPSNVMNITGNPVIGIFLQGDVYEMNRLTDGYWKYFHRLIKMAIAASNDSEQVIVELDGKKYDGEKITLDPYEKISNRGRLREFSDKSYEFIMSDQIPGHLYQIKTVINDRENPDIPLILETLTLKSVEFSSDVVAKQQH